VLCRLLRVAVLGRPTSRPAPGSICSRPLRALAVSAGIKPYFFPLNASGFRVDVQSFLRHSFAVAGCFAWLVGGVSGRGTHRARQLPLRSCSSVPRVRLGLVPPVAPRGRNRQFLVSPAVASWRVLQFRAWRALLVSRSVCRRDETLTGPRYSMLGGFLLSSRTAAVNWAGRMVWLVHQQRCALTFFLVNAAGDDLGRVGAVLSCLRPIRNLMWRLR